ncbi:hypothetical protein ACRRVA_03600 [Candidatus Cardinium hertigii]|uniref:hypothetical protein n=1 Tax=Candidatus Cardinium hertigii TaxID=247481 RepID=UPI003D7DEF2A
MQYAWLFIALFFSISAPLSYAETKAGAIKDAEFVIEKQKKNTVTQEQRLFFKAPIPTIKQLNKPLKTLNELKLNAILFHPAPQLYLPFSLQQKGMPPSCHRYCKIGICTSLLPYLAVGLDHYPFGKGIWSANLALLPPLWRKNSKEVSFTLEGRYDVGSWRFQPHLNYQPAWHKYSDLHTCMLHQGKISLFVKQASESSIQDGQVNIKVIDYKNKNISENLCTLHYKWIKRLDNWFFKIASYHAIARYVNGTVPQTRLIFSATPSLCLHLHKAMQLKVGLRMAYHNDLVPVEIPNFDLYPMVKIEYQIATWVAPYIGIQGMGVGGSVVPLHLHDVVAKNPFIASNWKLSHLHQYFKLYGGSKGIIGPNLSYRFDIAYRQLKNQSRIVKDQQDQVRLVYHSQDYKLVKVIGLVDYAMPKYHVTIKGTYYPYVANQSAPIWWYHKPRYKLKPTFTYIPHSKVFLTSNLHLDGATTVKDINGNSMPIGMRINLSVGIDYFIFKNFVAFLMASNLLNRAHIAYTRYPDQKFNLMVGLAYKW